MEPIVAFVVAVHVVAFVSLEEHVEVCLVHFQNVDTSTLPPVTSTLLISSVAESLYEVPRTAVMEAGVVMVYLLAGIRLFTFEVALPALSRIRVSTIPLSSNMPSLSSTTLLFGEICRSDLSANIIRVYCLLPVTMLSPLYNFVPTTNTTMSPLFLVRRTLPVTAIASAGLG